MRIDRRRSKRYRLELPIQFRIYLPSRPDVSSAFLSARLYDLSQSGMRLLTDSVQSGSLHIFHPDLTATEQSRLEIELPDNEQTLTLVGRVVWYDSNAEEHPYAFRVGVEFVDPTPEDQKRILSLIQRHQTSPPSPPSGESLPPSSE